MEKCIKTWPSATRAEASRAAISIWLLRLFWARLASQQSHLCLNHNLWFVQYFPSSVSSCCGYSSQSHEFLFVYSCVNLWNSFSELSVCTWRPLMAAAINSCALVVSLMVCTTLFVSDISIGNRTVYCGIWDLSNALNRMRRSRMLFRAFQVLLYHSKLCYNMLIVKDVCV